MRISIGSAAFTAKFEDNATAQAFKALLPMTATMNDLNRNEKYCDLPQNLPTAASAPGTIRAGDIMLYGAKDAGTVLQVVPDFVQLHPDWKRGRSRRTRKRIGSRKRPDRIRTAPLNGGIKNRDRL